jgi:hypothetical protein
MGLEESRLHTARGMLSAENNDAFSPSRHFASSLSWTNPGRMKHFLDNRRATLDSFEKAILLDPKNIRAKLMLGSGLLSDEDPAQRERGKELLREIASSEDAAAAKHASNVLSNAAFPFPVGIAPPRVAAPPRVTQKSSGNDRASIERRNQFLQQNFSRLVSLPFQPAMNSEAAIQYLRFKENLFEYEREYYCGFQFTVPEWIDGDFTWIYLLAKTETNKDFSIRGPRWYILPKTGQSKGFDDFDSQRVASYPHLQERFPYTHDVTVQDLA